MLTICSLSDLRNHQSDINYMAVRFLKNKINGVENLPQLSPSPELFSKLKQCRTVEEFNSFKESFLKEMEAQTSKEAIYSIKEILDLGYSVTICCYCGSREKCHTKFLAEMFKELGCEVSII